ncbi:phage tail protein [Eggerthellaceae bacterium zg-887]|uniref:phage distal tail protein n=1 Tax=Xiamenia xianingshaonis TaxID=2682776 RepID=UPI00140CDC1C|nr:phage tail domain-containing protein [Xiamenia xianingshaonis]NHM15799.1 phage tail protein [Xiamenia xianingshaonis]
MRSIVYNGVDLSDACSAEVVEKVALPVVPDAMVVPGRAGALLVSGRVPPRLVRVRLFMDAGYRPGTNGLADMRHRVYSALCSTAGGTLRLPDEPELEYHDVACTDAGAWSSLFEDGAGEVVFTLYDPVAYGMARSEQCASFEVGGSWPTWPTFELVAAVGSAVQVGCGSAFVRVEHAFTGGEVVRIDCEGEGVTVNGADARADVALSSDFFSLASGNVTLAFSGCSAHVTAFRERWL